MVNKPGTTLESTIPPTETAGIFPSTPAPEIFYPFGSAAGDTEHVETGGESHYSVSLSTPFPFFGNTYNQIYVNYNGLLTFNIPLLASEPFYNPTTGYEDFIAALWNDFDDYYSGVFSYQQYTNGSVLARATQDINQYFPQKSFTASWVFVVTWKYGAQQNPVILFQAVLISDGNLSFFLMNYGDCAELYGGVQAGYFTIDSTNDFAIPGASNGNYRNLKSTSNVNLPGRWAFSANSQLESVIGVRMRLTSFSDLTQSGNIEAVLQKMQQKLVSYGLSNSIEIKLRKVQKTQP
ncbi:sushi, nidogen and EGF-like domain-containing protein 1 [Garra rufa]|uniref:sushi, nidogen and EGF-like domain-containing protein 1 n=1 Tax=Garra rufa TaxID=137080 RepID=UPI003CCE88F3